MQQLKEVSVINPVDDSVAVLGYIDLSCIIGLIQNGKHQCVMVVSKGGAISTFILNASMESIKAALDRAEKGEVLKDEMFSASSFFPHPVVESKKPADPSMN